MGKIVKYDNRVNNVDFSKQKFTSLELNTMMYVFYLLKNQDTKHIERTYDEIKDILRLDNNLTTLQITKIIDKTLFKIGTAPIREVDDTSITIFNVFEYAKIDYKTKIISMKLNNKFYEYFNEFKKNYSAVNLMDYISLKSKYSKELFRHLKRFSATGKMNIYTEDLKIYMLCPKTYETYKFNQKVLYPSVAEIKKKIPQFKNLKVKTIRENKVIRSYEFKFTKIEPVNNIDRDLEKLI